MRKLLLLLLLGVLSTFVVSWACVILAHVLPAAASMTLTPAVGWKVDRNAQQWGSFRVCQLMADRLGLPGLEQVTVSTSVTARFTGGSPSRAEVMEVTKGYEAADIATGILDGKIDQNIAAQQLTWTRSGWPWLALESSAQAGAAKGDPLSRVTWGVALPIKAGLAGIPVLPLRPVMPGFAINIAIWVCLWAIPIVVIPSLRDYLNLVRKRCSRCGYDTRSITGALCPECGTSTQDERGPVFALIVARCRPLWRPQYRFLLCILLGLACTLLVSVMQARRIAAIWPPWPGGYTSVPPTATVFDPSFADKPVMVYGCEYKAPGARRVRLAFNYTAASERVMLPVSVLGDPNATLEDVTRGRDCAALVRAIERGDVALASAAGSAEWYESGWPFYALSFRTELAPASVGQPIYGGVQIDWPNIFDVSFVVPLTPMWPGLVANVLVWSSVPLVLFFGLPTVIRKSAGLFIHRADVVDEVRPLPHPGQKE